MVSRSDTGVVASKVYFPEECINVLLTCTSLCPVGFPNGFYWYGRRQSSNSRPYPEWVDAVCWPGLTSVETGESNLTTNSIVDAVPTLHPVVDSKRRVPTVDRDEDGAPEENDLTPIDHLEANLEEDQTCESEIDCDREINTNQYNLCKKIKKPQRFPNIILIVDRPLGRASLEVDHVISVVFGIYRVCFSIRVFELRLKIASWVCA